MPQHNTGFNQGFGQGVQTSGGQPFSFFPSGSGQGRGQQGGFQGQDFLAQLAPFFASGGLSFPAQLGLQAGGVALGALGSLFGGPSIQEQAFEQTQQRITDTPQIDPGKFQGQALAAALPQLRQQSQTAQSRFGIGNAQAFEQIFSDFQERQQQLQLQAQMQAQLANLQAFVNNTNLLASFG